ncbi:hypothetical protein Misp01_20310 [Microtetraspora sp. NBRC 13810]|uniref:hypothetical protein n=1 Tax=Microtetraspora sp. NBRC 13810 TaxID=3030990 RepID=UPI0024A3590F|nr:hypothetical protein [Microtetraspora sp. NBRC 13810]GLW06901.1 hypothetical protein Misp01_20310 [Microtetraspora sp. NBRC 13810]
MSSALLVIVVLLVVAAAITAVAVRGGRGVEPPAGPPPGGLEDHLRWLCAHGRKIEAIKVLRQRTPGLGLRQAKDAVEALEAGSTLEAALTRTGHRPPPVQAVPADLREQLLRLCAQNRRIEAIKVARARIPGLGLKQAKDLVEALHAGAVLSPATPDAITPAPDLAGRARTLKAEGHTEQAIFLVRGETGMSHAEAVAFVDSLQPSDTP